MGYLVNYAKSELDIILSGCTDAASQKKQEDINRRIIKICRALETKGQPDLFTSWEYVLKTINRLVRGRPLTHLTGEADEWLEAAKGLYQNKRCWAVFKQTKEFSGFGEADNGMVKEDRVYFLNGNEKETIDSFPYMPPVRALEGVTHGA